MVYQSKPRSISDGRGWGQNSGRFSIPDMIGGVTMGRPRAGLTVFSMLFLICGLIAVTPPPTRCYGQSGGA